MLDRTTFIGPWAGVPIAWNDDGTFDEENYRRDVRACCEAGAPGVYTHGTTGEFYAVELDEWRTVCTVTVEECREAGIPVLLGVTSTYTRGAVRRARIAAELGADGIQVALPFWLPVADDEVVPFFQQVAEAAPGLALSIYDTMRSKRALTLQQHRKIHQSVPMYLMVKYPLAAGFPGGVHAAHSTEGLASDSLLWLVFEQGARDAEEGGGGSIRRAIERE